jgi:hypothetical protein
MKFKHQNALLVSALLCLAVWTAQALDFEMQAQTKCIFEELNANVIVVGDYKAVNRDNPSVPIYLDLRVSPAWTPKTAVRGQHAVACVLTALGHHPLCR